MSPSMWAQGQDRAALLGVALMVAVSAMMAVDSVIVRYLSPGVHPFVMGFTRASFGLLAVLPWILARRNILQTNYRFRHLLRAVLKLAALICFFFAFASAPLADVTTYAADLLGLTPPPEIAYEDAQLSPTAKSFWAENKRLASRHLATLGVSLRYPTYREGLTALAAHHRDPSA